ncbi:substrate-binding domain-containing protein [Nonomuraea jabiensis]|uniref:substrate-binding domain-containing protein n=1 Tax=Nonomuraea jabiensis TaxID=882448 RepID=UPI0036865BAF
MTLQATHALGRSVAVAAGDAELFTYVYGPDTPVLPVLRAAREQRQRHAPRDDHPGGHRRAGRARAHARLDRAGRRPGHRGAALATSPGRWWRRDTGASPSSTPPGELRTSRDRHEGFRAGLGSGVPEPLAIETFTHAGGYDAARRLVERGFEDVEAVFAVNDVMAIGAMTAFRDAGVVPGADTGVAGFDDMASALDVVPALTSVAVPLREAGLSAMRLALSDDEGGDDVRLPARVVLRESTPGTTFL